MEIQRSGVEKVQLAWKIIAVEFLNNKCSTNTLQRRIEDVRNKFISHQNSGIDGGKVSFEGSRTKRESGQNRRLVKVH